MNVTQRTCREPRPAESGGREEQSDHDECDGEGVDQERERATKRSARTSPPSREDTNPTEAAAADRHELDFHQEVGRTYVWSDLQKIVRTEVAEHHPDELEADRRRISKEDKDSLEPPFQTAARKREEHVQEDHRRDEVECLPQCEETVVRRPCERREEGDEAGDDHEGPEATPGRHHQTSVPPST